MEYVTNEQLQALLDAVCRHADGATLAEIVTELPGAPGERTVQRWLALLRDGGQVQVIGSGASTRYRWSGPPPPTAISAAAPPPAAPSPLAPPTPPAGGGGLLPPTFDQVDDSDLEPMFAQAARAIVARACSYVEAVGLLTDHARRNNKPLSFIRAYLTYAIGRLKTLTPADGAQYQFTEADYTR